MTGEPAPSSMTDAVDALLRTDPQDAGCAQTWALIHVYAEVAAGGGDPEQQFPGISAHLRACPPCSDDYQGLLNALMTAEHLTAADDRARPGSS